MNPNDWKLDHEPDPFRTGKPLPPRLLYRGDAELLHEICADADLCVEIGTRYGGGAAIMGDVAKCVVTIEPFDGGWQRQGYHDHTVETVRKYLAPWPNVKLVVGYSHDVVALFCDDSIDVLFVDGNHLLDAVARDLALYYGKVKRGGFIIWNDYLNPHNMGGIDVKTVVDQAVAWRLLVLLRVQGCSALTQRT